MAQAVGLAAAIRYLQNVGMDAIAQHESDLVSSAITQLEAIPGVKILGPAGPRGGALSFLVDGIHPHDVGQVLDDDGIAVRVGHHCAWPLMRRYGVAATTRATFYLYNTQEDVASLVSGVKRAQQFFGTAS
jgi:cysteine desulfurase/selenocysteine lyase